ncbi:MAG: class I SAM-dependent methyltransferase [Ignavibacteriaceae bacterium]
MYYDPIKNVFAKVIRKNKFLRILFYKILDLMFLRSWYVRRELKKIRKEAGKRKISIYDAGSGYGQYTYFMAKRLQPASIYAADVKEDWINDCKNFFTHLGLNDVSFEVEDLTVQKHENRFDLIVSVDVMEHIKEDVKVFQNFFTALKQGGYLLINTPSVFGGSDVHNDEDESFVGEHARDGYSFEELRDKLTPIGFRILHSVYSYGFWGDKAWRLGIKYPMLMLNKTKLFFILLPFYYLITLPFTLFMMYIDYKSRNEKGSGIIIIVQKS